MFIGAAAQYHRQNHPIHAFVAEHGQLITDCFQRQAPAERDV
jgi:hypothetical protein